MFIFLFSPFNLSFSLYKLSNSFSKSFIDLSLSPIILSLFFNSFSYSFILVSFSVIIFVILVISLFNFLFSSDLELSISFIVLSLSSIILVVFVISILTFLTS